MMSARLFTKIKGSNECTMNSKAGIFAKFLICFLLIVLMPTILMGMIWYRNIALKDHTEIMEKETRILQEVNDSFTQWKDSAEQDLVSMLYGATFKNYVATKKPEYMTKVMTEAFRVLNLNEILYSIYLYDASEGTLWDSTTKMQSVETFYDTGWLAQLQSSVTNQMLSVRQNRDAAFETEEIFPEKLRQFYPAKIKNVMTIITPRTMGTTLLGNIDVEALGERLAQKFYSEGKNSYLLREDDVLYQSVPDDMSGQIPAGSLWTKRTDFFECQGTEHYWFACKLGDTDLYYVESIPLDILYSNSTEYIRYIIRVAAIILVFVIGLAGLIAYRIYHPLDELYSVISVYNQKSSQQPPSEETEGHAMKKAFESMKQSGKSEVDIRIMNDFVSAAMLRMLFDGIITQERFFQENSRIFHSQQEKNTYCLLLCRLRESLSGKAKEERDMRLKEVINVYLMVRLDGILSETSTGDFAILFCGKTDHEIEQMERFWVKIFNELTGDGNYFSSSRPFSAKDSIEEQYQICQKSLQNEYFFADQEEGWLTYPLPEENCSYKSLLHYAPPLIRCILMGEEDILGEKLSELDRELREKQKKDYALNLCARILGEIDKEVTLEPLEDGNADPVRGVYGQETEKQLLAYMDSVLRKKMRQLNTQEENQRENSYYQKALAYIHENYQKNINITEIADAIGISYVYLNKIFKAYHENDTKLIDYLNLIRINKSAELLQQTDASIAVIAEQVGYNNVQSFSRFFKKYKSMTPGEWRKKYRK